MDLVEGPSPGESISQIGPYRIADRLGRGGMGVVFQAIDSQLLRPVAIKFLSPRLAVSPVARTRFTREAQAAAAINHPNVVTIHAVAFSPDGLTLAALGGNKLTAWFSDPAQSGPSPLPSPGARPAGSRNPVGTARLSSG
jgi:serine/threonine protein kinase